MTLSSGRLANLSVRGNPSGTGGPDRPNVVGDWRLDADERSLARWFDTSGFAANNPFTFGNAGRNLITGPGVVNLDFAVYKEFRITERFRSQFRAESFNVTNTPGIRHSRLQVGDPTFGQINGADRSRNMQFGLKVIF